MERLTGRTLRSSEGVVVPASWGLTGGGFFGGDGVGLVDVALGGVLSWMKVTEVLSGDKIFDAAKTPLLAAWVERFSELDAAKVALPDVGRLLEFAKAREAAASK